MRKYSDKYSAIKLVDIVYTFVGSVSAVCVVCPIPDQNSCDVMLHLSLYRWWVLLKNNFVSFITMQKMCDACS